MVIYAGMTVCTSPLPNKSRMRREGWEYLRCVCIARNDQDAILSTGPGIVETSAGGAAGPSGSVCNIFTPLFPPLPSFRPSLNRGGMECAPSTSLTTSTLPGIQREQAVTGPTPAPVLSKHSGEKNTNKNVINNSSASSSLPRQLILFLPPLTRLLWPAGRGVRVSWAGWVKGPECLWSAGPCGS